MGLTAAQKLSYYKNKELADEAILSDAAIDNHVIYGAKAINAQLPGYLNKSTDDFDIFSKTPKKDAIQMEKKLDKSYGGDFFSVEKAKFANTWKVKSNVTKKTVVDYTYPTSRVPSTNIGGNKYAKVGWMKNKIGKTLSDPKNAYRADKDREALQRINLYKKEQDFLLGGF